MRTIQKTSVILSLLLLSSGYAWAGFFEGFEYFEAGKYEQALDEFRPLAEEGNAFAQLYLGIMYDKGYGVPRDSGKAVKWWRMSAEQGGAVAQYNLGAIYAHGVGVEIDFKEAASWWKLAAAQGNAQAKAALKLIGEQISQ